MEKDIGQELRTVIKYLCENYHPHVKLIIEPTGWELFEGIECKKVDEFLVD